jgi:uncharacterized membrane protein
MQRHQVMFLTVGLLLVLLAVPLARRRVRPNRWYGLRLRSTFADEQVWYDANAASGRDMVIFGVAFILVALLVPVLPGVTDTTYTGLLGAGSIVLTVRGIRVANRLVRGRREGA